MPELKIAAAQVASARGEIAGNIRAHVSAITSAAEHAARFRMLVVMANHAASAGTHVPVGRSAIWAPGGAWLAEAARTESSLVIATRAPGARRGEVVRI